MPRIPHRARLAALLLAGCAGARTAPAGDGAAPGVALHFAWPDGFRARVLLRHRVLRAEGQPVTAVVRQIVEVEPRGKELWIRTRDSEAEGNDPDLATNLRIAEALVTVVDRGGAYLRTEGVDRALAILAEQEGPQDPERARRTMERLTAEDWETSVGAWRGQRLEVGKPRRRVVEGSTPLLPGVVAALDVEYGLQGLAPCETGEKERRCAELVYRTRPAPAGEPVLLRRLQEALPEGAPAVEDAAASSETTLVVEPDTLVPRRMTVRQELRLRLRSPDGDLREVEERSVDEYDFAQELAL